MLRHILRRNNLLTSPPSRFSSAPPLIRQACGFSSSPSPEPEPEPANQSPWREANVSVWWDLDFCTVPAGYDITKVPTAVEKALLANEIEGPRSISAFGDLSRLSGASHEALSNSGIQMNHLCKGSFVDRHFFDYIANWVHSNPPPAHVLLLSGNKQHGGTLSRLRCNYYNTLLAYPGEAPEVLSGAATVGWEWSSLLNGEVTGKSFNLSPDISSPEYTEYVTNPLASAKLLFRPEHERKAILDLDRNSDKIRRYLRKQEGPLSLDDLRQRLARFDLYVRLYNADFAAALGRIREVEVSYSGDQTWYAFYKPPAKEDEVESNKYASEFEDDSD